MFSYFSPKLLCYGILFGCRSFTITPQACTVPFQDWCTENISKSILSHDGDVVNNGFFNKNKNSKFTTDLF